MRLQVIQEGIQRFKQVIRSDSSYLVHWESLKHFQEHWSIDAVDFAAMYDASLQNSLSRQLWSAHSFEPKKMMLTFAHLNEDFVRMAFKGLFDESLPLSSRIDRFMFYCDELLSHYQELNPSKRINTHHHDYSVVFMYLAFRFPEKYGIYHFDLFQSFLTKVGAKNVPLTHDLERFPKVLQVIYTLISKDEELMDIHRSLLLKGNYFSEKTLLLSSSFISTFK